MPRRVISVPERGTVDVDPAVWAKLAVDPTFWQLVEGGVLMVEQGSATTVRLRGGCYVGRAVLGDIVLELKEKVPGSLLALIRHASRAEFHVYSIPVETSELGPLIAVLIEQFNQAVSLYLTRGRLFTYQRQQRIGALVGGRLDVTGTIRLRARGLRHLAQFEKNAANFDTPLNEVILAALREVDRINYLLNVDPKLVARSRALALLFSDCRTWDVLFGSRETFIKNAAAFEIGTRDPLLRDLMSLAGVLLAHESFEPVRHLQRHSPRSWFLNLEALFEIAVRNVLSDAIGDRATVQNGRSVRLSIFTSTGSRHLANPDMVVRTLDGSCAIGDAKFKTQDDRGDLYQLLVHAATFNALTAFLVSPGETYAVEALGTAKTGATVRRFAIDLRQLEIDIRKLGAVIMNELGSIANDSVSAEKSPSG